MESNNLSIEQTVNTAQSAIPDIGLVMLGILTLFALIFSLLMYRRVAHMISVLPTSLSPHLRTVTMGYIIYTVITLAAIIVAVL